MKSAFDEKERALFHEGTRLVPGMLACRERRDMQDMMVLAEGVREAAVANGIPPCHAWSIMFSSALHWCLQLTTSLAREREVPVEKVINEMVMAAATWQAEDDG